MSAPDYLAKARSELDALAELLQRAAAEGRPIAEILREAMQRLDEARSVIASMYDEGGTE